MNPSSQALHSIALDHCPGETSTHCVLYVEDHPVNVELMRAIFTRRPDYTLIVATDGESAMEAAGRIKPDLLLLDINLPDCLGSDLLVRMRKLRDWDDVPAVAVTAEHGFDAEGTTFCEMWLKPIRLQETLDGLDRLLLDSGVGRDNDMPHSRRVEWRPLPANIT